MYETIYSLCVEQKIPPGLAVEITQLCSKLPHLCLADFQEVLRGAEHEHLNNKVRGRANARHCGFLLRHKLRDALAVVESRRSGPRVAPLTIKEIQQRKAEAGRREAEIRANPLHEDYAIDDFSIRCRVETSAREAATNRGSSPPAYYVRYAESKTTNHQDTIRLSGNLYQEVMGHALTE